jgi:hypothetical protein
MKRRKKEGTLPVSLRDLSSYLGISPALLSMIQTGRHGDRGLNIPTSRKMDELFAAYQHAKNHDNQKITFKKPQSTVDSAALEKQLLLDAAHAESYAGILKCRLVAMI